MSKDVIELAGVVKECFPNNNFRIECDNGHVLNAYLSGKMRKFFIKVLPGDRVMVEITPYDLTLGRITKRVSDTAAGGATGNKQQGSK
jgi:translation initiation factor IF-1